MLAVAPIIWVSSSISLYRKLLSHFILFRNKLILILILILITKSDRRKKNKTGCDVGVTVKTDTRTTSNSYTKTTILKIQSYRGRRTVHITDKQTSRQTNKTWLNKCWCYALFLLHK